MQVRRRGRRRGGRGDERYYEHSKETGEHGVLACFGNRAAQALPRSRVPEAGAGGRRSRPGK